MIKGGYMGKILRIDLSKQKIEEEELPSENVLRKYVGGTGLGLKYLFDETAPSMEPLDPESPLIFMTGPLTGTVWPCSGRHCVISLSTDFAKAAGTSWGGGFWPAKLKWAGYDGIIVQGKSSEPVYLLLKNGKPELREAGHLWGKETRETEDLIRKELGDPECSAVCIGPAGERCLPASILLNDQNHVSGKSGAGQLMGSKLLKAIAISQRGGSVPVVDAKKLTELALEYQQVIVNSPVTDILGQGGLLTHYGNWTPELLAFKNLSDEEGRTEWAKELTDVVRASEVIPRPCFNCPLGCCQDTIIGKGPYRGYRSRASGGGQWEGIACRIGIMEGSTVIYITDLANRLGTECGITGAKMGLLYECYEKGMIDKKFTDGLELNWGNADAAIKLLYKFVNQEGIGKLLAKGQDEIAKVIGHGAEKFLAGAKGLAFHHDYRGSWEVILAHAFSTTAISPEGFGFDAMFPAMAQDFGYSGLLPRFDKDRAARAVRLTAIKNRWDNSLGICQFSVYGTYPSMDYTQKALRLAVGWDFDREEVLLQGERLMNLARVFNMKRGYSIKDDMHIGPRLLEGFKTGKYKDKPLRPHLKKIVKDFYSQMGWDTETGVPLDDTLMRVGLDELTEEARKLRPRPVEIPTSPKEESRKAKRKSK